MNDPIKKKEVQVINHLRMTKVHDHTKQEMNS